MNKFNRILLASGLAATASLMANSAAFAETPQGTVTLNGTVPSTLSMTVSEAGYYSELPLVPGENYTDMKVAEITGASTNSAGGLKVVASSNWTLTSGSNSIAIINIGEAQGTSSTYATSGNSATGNVTLGVTRTVVAGNAVDSSIFIDYSVSSIQAAGDYTGSITFTASDN
jgi:hypothetical protein